MSSSCQTLALSIVLFLSLAFRAYADCECGWAVNSTSDNSYALFTQSFSTNFLLEQDITSDPDWQVLNQNYTTTAPTIYGRQFEPKNVVSNPSTNGSVEAAGVLGGPPGLQLWVRGRDPNDGLVSSGEIVTNRSDMLYGSFRAKMKMTNTNGTCGALFFYYNDTQEIDVEFYSRTITDDGAQIQLALQSLDSEANGNSAAGTDSYDLAPLGFRPDEDFHEYRFDWTPESVTFYVDGVYLAEFIDNVPVKPGGMRLNHWSNGNSKTMGGPPATDALLVVESVQFYFNSSSPATQKAWRKQCAAGQTAVCRIDGFSNSPANDSASSTRPQTPHESATGCAYTNWGLATCAAVVKATGAASASRGPAGFVELGRIGPGLMSTALSFGGAIMPQIAVWVLWSIGVGAIGAGLF